LSQRQRSHSRLIQIRTTSSLALRLHFLSHSSLLITSPKSRAICFETHHLLIFGFFKKIALPASFRPSLLLHTHFDTFTKMSFDMDWSPDFCLACDRQTDGNVYCSEACRLAEYEQASSNAGSTASSPMSPRAPVSWPTTRPSNGFYMEPAYNFSKAQPYGTTPPRTSNIYQLSRPQSSPITFSSKAVLTPSSSHSSLFSMQSSTSSTASEPAQLSDESRKALRAYASSFDQSRYSRRQSTH
jgi:hypothetical protein